MSGVDEFSKDVKPELSEFADGNMIHKGHIDSDVGTKLSTYKMLVRIYKDYTRFYKWRIIFGFIMLILVAISTAFTSWLIKPVVNEVFSAKNTEMLIPIGLAVFGAFFVKAISGFLGGVSLDSVGQRVLSDMQIDLFDRIIVQDIGLFSSTSTGRLTSHFTNDINRIRYAALEVIFVLGKSIPSLLGLVGVMFVTEWSLALLSLFIIPTVFYPIMKLGRKMRKVSANTQQHQGEYLSLLNQAFVGVRQIKAYQMEEIEKQRLKLLVNKIYNLFYRTIKIQEASRPITEIASGLAIVAVIIYGGWRVINSSTTSGDFFAFLTAALMCYEHVKKITNLSAKLQDSVAAAERIFYLLDYKSKIIEKTEHKELHSTELEIEFRNVSFNYDTVIADAQKTEESGLISHIIDDISIKFEANKTTAIVGVSGSGKSTLLNLIARFYDCNKGTILIDNIDIKDLSINSLRKNIAWVSQEVVLFDTSIYDNILLGDPNASEEQVHRAARLAAASDFIEQLDNSYNTMVGEGGLKLSGGQRQRVAIARAILRDAPILLLDEATAALDSRGEIQVQRAIENLQKNRTTIVIAHRLSTIKEADNIVVLSKGKIVAQGTHEQLLANEHNDVYRQLYHLQFEQR